MRLPRHSSAILGRFTSTSALSLQGRLGVTSAMSGCGSPGGVASRSVALVAPTVPAKMSWRMASSELVASSTCPSWRSQWHDRNPQGDGEDEDGRNWFFFTYFSESFISRFLVGISNNISTHMHAHPQCEGKPLCIPFLFRHTTNHHTCLSFQTKHSCPLNDVPSVEKNINELGFECWISSKKRHKDMRLIWKQKEKS